MRTEASLPPDLTRRQLLQRGLGVAGGLLLPSWLDQGPQTSRPMARSVIQIWLWGGACHIDSFDPKPAAGEAYTGPLKSPIPTNVDVQRLDKNDLIFKTKEAKFAAVATNPGGLRTLAQVARPGATQPVLRDEAIVSTASSSGVES